MKKIPTLFKREFEGHNIKRVLPELSSPDLEEVLLHGIPTIKWDGACTMIKDGVFYKRYDAKRGKTPPINALPCQPAPDPVTGHWPHWVPVDPHAPENKWFMEALRNEMGQASMIGVPVSDGTYEAIGVRFQGNPYLIDSDILLKHGDAQIRDLTDRTFEGIRTWLEDHNQEGIVFWYNGEPRCKIKRTDFGIPWMGYTPD